MCPISHIYVATKVTGKETPYLVIGSVLPDISLVPNSHIDHKKFHDKPSEFYNFVSNNYPELIDLGLGVRLHCQQDRGADYYSDGDGKDQEGFAITYGRGISDRVAKVINPESSKSALVLAHNFIEAAIDVLLIRDNSELLTLYEESMGKVSFELIAECLATYLDKDSDLILMQLKTFFQILSPENMIDKNTLTQEIVFPLLKEITKDDVTFEEILELLNRAEKIIEDKYIALLAEAINEMRHDFREII